MSAQPRIGLPLLVVAGLGAASIAAAAAAPGGYRAPEPVVRQLPNGLTIAVFEDGRLPLVQVQLLVPAGAAQEPAGEAGVANLTIQMLSQGTASRTREAFAAAVDALGGSVGGTASREFTTVNGAFLAGDFEAGLELLADAVVHPVFGEGPLPAVKDQMAGGLVRVRQNPAALADEHLWAAVFPGRPYGRSPLGAMRALSALGVAQVQAFHRDHYRPDRALLAIAGDVPPERAFRAAEEVLASWGGRARATGPPAPPPPAPGWRVRIVDAPDLARVELRIGTVGPSRDAADYDALVVAGELLAAGSEDRLRVAVNGLRDAGLFSIATSAPVDSAAATLARLRAAVARWATTPPAGDAIARVRHRFAAGFPLQLETRSGLIARWMAAALKGTDARFADYPERIGSISEAEIRAAIGRWVATDRMVLVAVGPAERLRLPLAAIGTVEVVPPEVAGEVVESPSTTTSPPTAEQTARGRALASQAIAAHGGLERLRGIKDSSLEGDMVMMAGPHEYKGQIVQLRKEPMRFSFATTFRAVRSVQVLDGDRGWSQAGGDPIQIVDLDSVNVLGLRAGFRSDLQHLLLTAADPAARVAWRGQERRDDRDADVIEVVAGDGERRVLFLDATNHQLVAMEQNEGGHSTRRLYRDLRPVSGLLWPFTEERLLDGQRTMTLTMRRVAFNVGLKDEIFRRPASDPEAAPATPVRPRPR